MWMEQIEMELNGREELLNPTIVKQRLTTFNGSSVYDTHDKKVVGRGKRNRKMA